MSDLTFTTIEEAARHSLEISRDEYAACNYIQTWAAFPSNSTPGFCNRTRGQMAAFIGISERGMQKMLSRLEDMDLIKRASQYQFLYRITEKWFNCVVAAKEDRTGEQSSRNGVNKVPAGGEQSSRRGANKVHPHKEYNKEVIRSEEKTRFAPPAPAESSNLEEEKTKSGLVAPPPAESPVPPTHLVKTAGPENPGLMEVEGIALPVATRVSTTIEAEKKISEWITGEGLETVRFRYETAKERFDPAQATAIAAHYCSVFTKNPANKERLLKDPVTHFSDGLFSYLKSEQQYGRNRVQPGASAQPTPSVPPSNYKSSNRY